MRIGFEAKRATHNFRGLGNYSRGLIEGMIEFQPQHELFLYAPPIKNKKGQEWLNTLTGKVHVRLPDSFLGKTFPPLWRSVLVADDIKKEKLDIYHGLSHEIPMRLDSLPVKKVVTMHDLIYLRYPEFFPWIDRLVYARKFTYACKHSDLVIAICEQTKEDLIRFLKVDEKKIKVHYQSCSPIFYHELSSERIAEVKRQNNLSKPYILNVGAFEERKNQLNLVEAFALAAPKIEEDLVLVGQGKAYKNKVAQRVSELKLTERVKILNSVHHEELPALYQGASVFCFPSLFEGFGIPIVEALFSKTPVITSHGSVFPESAGPDAVFIDPLSSLEMAEALVGVLGSSVLREKMISGGTSYVQRFHRRDSTLNLMDLYSQVINS